jgi:hypothetical protein
MLVMNTGCPGEVAGMGEHHALYSWSDITRMIKSRRNRPLWVCAVQGLIRPTPLHIHTHIQIKEDIR